MAPQAPTIGAELIPLLPRLRRFALTLCRVPADADDLVQMTCERAIAFADKRDATLPLLPWLYTMARNLQTSEQRKVRVRTGAGTVDAADAAELISTSGGEEASRARDVIAAVMALPEGMSTVLLLVAVEGHSYAEASAILDIPVGTVMSRISNARARLRQTLQEGTA